ncbi:MAG TPA: metal ABC transporter permease, partial [Methylomirabilota bacterium]|nr:metal ABC transporter permease [Methylomirabilota bacterium]
MSVALEFLWLPFVACLVLTGIHVYLGLHVLARGVIFVDLALAQVAALGITVAFLAGHAIQSDAAYWYALAFTVAGAALFAASRTRRGSVPQEAVIGIVYAVSAAVAVLVVDRAPQGSEHIKQLLVGSILTVSPRDVATLAAVYTVIGAIHWLIRRPLLAISFEPEGERARATGARWWDFLFYVSFGLVVTSSVRIAGVLLVFSFLIVPATAAALVARGVRWRLVIGWGLGGVTSALGLASSYAWDLPTGAAVVTTFGAVLAGVAAAVASVGLARRVKTEGFGALRGIGFAVCAGAALAGLTLAAFPRLDHHWLDWLEEAVPAVQLVFLTPHERETRRESLAAVRHWQAELARLRALQQDIQWGSRQASEESQERLRQFLAGRAEIT